mgnify:CR=1 FL=1
MSLTRLSALDAAFERGAVSCGEAVWLDTARGIDGVYYQVKEDFPGGRALYDIFVASDATSIDMATVAPVVQVDELVDTRGPQGESAYDLAVKAGFAGSEAEWVASLGGIPGPSAYDAAVSLGFEGSTADWIESLKGEPGEPGEPGEKGWVAITQAEYDALPSPDASTLYVIVG